MCTQELSKDIDKSRSAHTRRAYANGLNKRVEVLESHGQAPEQTPVAEFPEAAVI